MTSLRSLATATYILACIFIGGGIGLAVPGIKLISEI